MSFIAEQPVDWLLPDGRRLTGRIAIELPRMMDTSWARCGVALEPVDPRVREINGEGTLQALVLALRHLVSRLEMFRDEGGRILEPGTDKEMNFAPILGPLLGAAEPRDDK